MSQAASPLILSIDQGTTSSRAILFDGKGTVQSMQQKELVLTYPQPGWVEQDAQAIWRDTLAVCNTVLDAIPEARARTLGIGITNQRETTVVWDKRTGQPIYNAIVWQDRRTALECNQLREEGHEAAVTAKTGLLLDPYFSATKIAWILEHIEGAREKAKKGYLLFGTIDTFLLWQLTGGEVHATDATNASRTLLFDIVKQDWDDDLLALFNIPKNMLPIVRDNTCHFGITQQNFLGCSLPVLAMIGDQQSALVGQACFTPGMVKSTYGTGCFMLMNLGRDPIVSTKRLLTTTAYRLNGQAHYAIEGSIFVAGAAVQWLRDGLNLFANTDQSEALATSINDNEGVYFVPALTGLGAPYWQPNARGTIVGLTRDTGPSHIARAALEAQAYQTRDLLSAMVDDVGRVPPIIRADGGLVSNQFVCQFLADIVRSPIEVPKVAEATAWGAASLAALQAGLFADLDSLSTIWQRESHYSVEMDQQKAERLYSGWQTAVKATLSSC